MASVVARRARLRRTVAGGDFVFGLTRPRQLRHSVEMTVDMARRLEPPIDLSRLRVDVLRGYAVPKQMAKTSS